MGRDITQIFFTTSVSKELSIKHHIQEVLIFFLSNWIGKRLSFRKGVKDKRNCNLVSWKN